MLVCAWPGFVFVGNGVRVCIVFACSGLDFSACFHVLARAVFYFILMDACLVLFIVACSYLFYVWFVWCCCA